MAGQTALTGRQRRSLADDGYLLLPSVLAAATVYGLVGRLGQLVRTTVDEWDATPDMTWERPGWYASALTSPIPPSRNWSGILCWSAPPRR